jgi:hypothetical protein
MSLSVPENTALLVRTRIERRNGRTRKKTRNRRRDVEREGSGSEGDCVEGDK